MYAEENEKIRTASSTYDDDYEVYEDDYEVYEDDYEVYMQRYQKYSLKKIKVNAKNANDASNDTFFQKLMKRKWWVIGATTGGVLVTGLAVGLPLHFKNNGTIPPATAVGIPVTASRKTASNIHL